MAETSEIVRSVCIIMDALHQRTGAITDAHQAYGYIVLSHDVTPLPEAGRTEAWPDRPVPVQTRRWSGAIPPSGGLSAPSPAIPAPCVCPAFADRKSTRLNSSH